MRTIADLKNMENYKKLISAIKGLNVHGTVYVCNSFVSNPNSKPFVIFLTENYEEVDTQLESIFPELVDEDADYYGPSAFGIFVMVFGIDEETVGFIKVEEV